jgi:hypothetical protein
VAIRGSKRPNKLKGVKNRFIALGQRATLKLKVSEKALPVIKQALRRHRRVRATLTIEAGDAAGNTTIRKAPSR